ncbi:hypothetical protein BDV96DRAFT_654192 [Lophiotrema nucula]|uniref:BTB domain-containing protein n=1 Tax=Lophiotrema nucula TaxID=690887 RepID=A0A6A5YJ81_9PLEO|nr:hypothetical protein BDV96DRAFT_654192 [Lophiotrema nucula]
MADNARQILVDSVKQLYASEKYSDLTITCGAVTYRVHKSVVCPRSEFFEKAVRFKVGKEAEEGNIDLSKEDPESMKLLVEYFYEAEYTPHQLPAAALELRKPDPPFPHTCNNANEWCMKFLCEHHRCFKDCRQNCHDFVCQSCYPPPLPLVDLEASHLLTHAKMYEIGDRLQIAGLKELARVKFEQACLVFWDSEMFAQAARHAFTTTPDCDKGLREIVSDTLNVHLELVLKEEIETLLYEQGMLAVGLLKRRVEGEGLG